MFSQMYNFHSTPEVVVRSIINKHIPRTSKLILDPAIGDGALVNAFCNKDVNITGVDIDNNKIEYNKARGAHFSINLVCDDFLYSELPKDYFDLIVCNPPFDAKNFHDYRGRKIPLEAAFLEKSISHCREGGRLIFILPSSVVQGSRLNWFRIELLKKVRLVYSYKLNNYCFKGVEGDFSVLIFDKNRKKTKCSFITKEGKKVVDDTYDVFDSDLVCAKVNMAQKISGLEYSYKRCDEAFDFIRGRVTSGYKSGLDFHTTSVSTTHDVSLHQVSDVKRVTSREKLERSDFFIKRVSRNLCSSISLYGGDSVNFTDCVIKIRPKDISIRNKLLFSLMVTLANENAKSLIERGSCAKYLDLKALKSLEIPMDIDKIYPSEFSKFIFSNHSRRLDIARKINFKIKNGIFKDCSHRIKVLNDQFLTA